MKNVHVHCVLLKQFLFSHICFSNDASLRVKNPRMGNCVGKVFLAGWKCETKQIYPFNKHMLDIRLCALKIDAFPISIIEFSATRFSNGIFRSAKRKKTILMDSETPFKKQFLQFIILSIFVGVVHKLSRYIIEIILKITQFSSNTFPIYRLNREAFYKQTNWLIGNQLSFIFVVENYPSNMRFRSELFLKRKTTTHNIRSFRLALGKCCLEQQTRFG